MIVLPMDVPLADVRNTPVLIANEVQRPWNRRSGGVNGEPLESSTILWICDHVIFADIMAQIIAYI